MNEVTPETTPTAQVATHALLLIQNAEDVIRDMRHQVEEVEAVCAATRARLAQRRSQGR